MLQLAKFTSRLRKMSVRLSVGLSYQLVLRLVA